MTDKYTLYYPQRVFETIDGAIPIYHIHFRQIIGNATVINGVANKVIEVISLTCQSDAAGNGTLAFISNSVLLWKFHTPSNTQPPYMEQDSINGLFRSGIGDTLTIEATNQVQLARLSYRIYALSL